MKLNNKQLETICEKVSYLLAATICVIFMLLDSSDIKVKTVAIIFEIVCIAIVNYQCNKIAENQE